MALLAVTLCEDCLRDNLTVYVDDALAGDALFPVGVRRSTADRQCAQCGSED